MREPGLACLRDAGLEVVNRSGMSGCDLLDAVGNVEALLVRSQTRVDEALLERAGALLVVGRVGVGYENIDVGACDRLGIAVMNTPGASAITTAERTIALMMALLHQIPAADRSIRAGKWIAARPWRTKCLARPWVSSASATWAEWSPIGRSASTSGSSLMIPR